MEQKNSSIKRLKRLLFGPGSDKRTLPAPRPEAKPLDASAEPAVSSAASPDEAVNSVLRPKRKGHGRLGAESYVGAKVVSCADPVLRPGDRCPHTLCGGRLYDTDEPTILIRLTGQPLVGATRFEQQVLRCSTCQQRYTSPLPEGMPPQKYDASADVAIALAKYAAGLPCYRLSRLQRVWGVPLPESVQFERCEAVADAALPVLVSLRKPGVSLVA